MQSLNKGILLQDNLSLLLVKNRGGGRWDQGRKQGGGGKGVVPPQTCKGGGRRTQKRYSKR